MTNRRFPLEDGIAAVLNENGQLLESFTRGVWLAGDIGTLVAVTHSLHSATPGTYYLHHNHRGDVILARQGATTTATYTYGAFGKLTAQTGTDMCRFKFSSKERDQATGFSYYGFRFYAPEWQRWLNQDPLGEPGGINLYVFCANNTFAYVDIDGLALFGLYDSWGEYFGEVGDVLWGETQGALESLTFGLFNPCYTSDPQKQGGGVGEGLAFVGETAAGGYGLWKGLGKKALKEASEQLGKGASKAFLEELGQKTLKNADFGKLKDLSPLERGKELLKKGKLGLNPAGNWKETLKKGPTPLGALGLGLYGGATATKTALDGPTKGNCL